MSSRQWRRWRRSPSGGLWSGRHRRRAPAIWVQLAALRPLETRCPGTCPNTIASRDPSRPLETCWTQQRGPSSASQVPCSHRKENRGRSEGDVFTGSLCSFYKEALLQWIISFWDCCVKPVLDLWSSLQLLAFSKLYLWSTYWAEDLLHMLTWIMSRCLGSVLCLCSWQNQ